MDNQRTIKVANGLVVGNVERILDRNVVQFLCIPYCKAPVKELRFQKPQPCEIISNDVINKLDFETCPPQTYSKLSAMNTDISKIPKGIQHEDSLYVNIWCPVEILDGKSKKEVFVYIYGGGFIFGSSSLDAYNGSAMASKNNVIVVTFNYRLGILGFLRLDDLVKGNMGIWDQNFALKWIYENISAFNGDRENITLGGCSAGGASVSLHLLIEESKSYFSKAIIQSGVCLCDWALHSKEEVNRRSIAYVNDILEKQSFPIQWSPDLSNKDKKLIIEFLQNINFELLISDYEGFVGTVQLAWGPYLDGELIKENPLSLFQSGKFKKCPTVFVTTQNEGSVFIMFKCPQIVVDGNNHISEKDFNECLDYHPHYPIICKDSTKDKIKTEYKIQRESISIDMLDKVLSDLYFICPSIEMASIVSKFNKEVFYINYNILPEIRNPKWIGVYHGSDTLHFFGNNLKSDFVSTNSEKETSELVLKQFNHFMKNGILLDNAPRYDEKSKNYISFEMNKWTPKIFSDSIFHKIDFWKKLKANY